MTAIKKGGVQADAAHRETKNAGRHSDPDGRQADFLHVDRGQCQQQIDEQSGRFRRRAISNDGC